MKSPPEISQFRLLPLFRELDRDTLAQIAAHAHWRELASGEALFSQGQAGTHFYLVKSGTIKLYLLSADGQEHVLEMIGREGLFAEAIMFTGGNYPVHAAALEPSRLVAFESASFRQLLQERPKLCMGMLAALSRQLHSLIADIDRVTLQHGSRRLAQYLLAQPSRSTGSERVVQLPASKQAIASLLDIRPETLSRMFAQLTDQGLIRVQGDAIVVLSAKRLKQI